MAEVNVTFFNKQAIICPACKEEFNREELRSGRGRLIAGNVTEELQRLYEPSKKFGEIFPLVYVMNVCPFCLYSALPSDFENINENDLARVRSGKDDRRTAVDKIFKNLDFGSPRRLQEGLASYILGLLCYEKRHKDICPTFKQALCSIRAAWTSMDLHRKFPSDNWDYLAKVFYRKAQFFYAQTVEYEQNGKERLGKIPHYGPDIDKNYGYEGIMYLAGLLEFHHGPKNNDELRKESLARAKRTVARIVGMGKASKSKPSLILEKSRDLYDNIKAELNEDKDNE